MSSSPSSAIPTAPIAERGVYRSDERRRDLAARALQGRQHRRDSGRVRPEQPQRHLRRSLGRPPGPVGKRSLAGLRPAASSNPPTAAPPGANSPTACPPSNRASAASASASPAAIPKPSTPPSRPPTRSAASIAPTTPAKPGAMTTAEARTWGRGTDFAEIRVHPNEPRNRLRRQHRLLPLHRRRQDLHAPSRAPPAATITTASGSTPTTPKSCSSPADQGATITVNGGETWSSWYNQPTAQFYHVTTDNQWPYWVYGGQQESGSAGVASPRRLRRTSPGAIGAPSASRNTATSLPIRSIRTSFTAANSPVSTSAPARSRTSLPKPLPSPRRQISLPPHRSGLFSPVDPHAPLLRRQRALQDQNGGSSGHHQPRSPRKGVIYTVAPSHQDVNTIWVGTDDGLIHVTRDGGKTWQNVTPPNSHRMEQSLPHRGLPLR